MHKKHTMKTSCCWCLGPFPHPHAEQCLVGFLISVTLTHIWFSSSAVLFLFSFNIFYLFITLYLKRGYSLLRHKDAEACV